MENDLISRAAALEVLSIVCYYNGDFLKEGLGMLVKPGEVALRLRRVPAVEAVEVVRCKDCEYFQYGDYCSESKMEHSRCREDDYCSYAKRKNATEV